MQKFISQFATAISASRNHSAAGKSDNLYAAGKSDFVYPPSIQGDLFNYLKPEQQETLKPILRIIKRQYQAMLCAALLDFIEGNGIQPIGSPMLDKLQKRIIEECKLRPLR